MALLFGSGLSAFVSILAAMLVYIGVRRAVIHSRRMAEIGSYITIGARAYLNRQFRTILFVTPVLAIAIGVFLGVWVAVTFVLGVCTSLAVVYLGMSAAVRANVQTAEAAIDSPAHAFRVAVVGGSVMGFSVTGFSVLMLTILYWIFRDPAPLVGFGFGASLAAFFAQIGGGIFTKSADVGADLVGKIERNIPEDDPRNPAVIADLVGDNVGDCAGRGSDLFETQSDDMVTGMLVALLYTQRYGPLVVFFPLLLKSVGLLSSLVGVYALHWLRRFKPDTAFQLGMGIASLLATLGSALLAHYLLHDWSMLLAIFLGLMVTLVSAWIVRYYVGAGGRPVREISEASNRGVALTIITGLGYGLRSPVGTILMIVGAVCVAYVTTGNSLLGVVAVNIGTDLLIGFIATADTFGPISDNASGIAEMSGAEPRVLRSLSALDAVGNTMKATTKAYAMSSGTVTAFVLFATFFSQLGLTTLDISRPFVPAFLLLGIALPYLIASLVISSVAKTAQLMVDEVRRQFASIVGLIEGRASPDYAKCVDIATVNALKEMVAPGLLSVVIPLAVGLGFGGWELGAFLIGSVSGAALLGPFLNNAGTAFDNAKKVIEEAGLKGTPQHQAAVAADTIGDPLKDVAGPALLIFMKLVGMAALLIVNVVR